MNIGTYTLFKSEEEKILEIYHKFKQAFSGCELFNKDDILEISDYNHAMCYFTYSNFVILVKFENNDKEINIFDNSIYKNISSTIKFLKKNNISHKEIIQQSKSATNCFKYTKASTRVVIKKFAKLLRTIDCKYYNISFNQCSTRLKNILYKNRIYTIERLQSYQAEDILNLKKFGEKGLLELYEFLTKVCNNKISTSSQSANTPPPDIAANKAFIEEQCNMLNYINKVNKRRFVCNLKNAFNLYLENNKQYAALYLEFIDYLSKSSLYKLTPREQPIFNSRFGINEAPKTLQKIGDLHSLTKERIRQVLVEILVTIKSVELTNIDLVKLEYQKCQLFEKIGHLSVGGFFAYIFFECNNIEQLKLMYTLIFKKDIELKIFKNELEKQCYQYRQKLIYDKRAKTYNDHIYKLIKFKDKKVISAAAYSKLKTERKVSTPEECLTAFSFNNKTYQCESFLEKEILGKLLAYKTFKRIKTQSLKIPFNNSYYYPDFQCLTHDNNLVIIEVKPLLNMCEAYNIKKFQALKAYCEQYGFGYLIIDDKNNSFFNINEPNEKFNARILEELDKNSKVKYNKYKEFYDETHASLKNLLTLIKDKNLILTFPFKLTK